MPDYNDDRPKLSRAEEFEKFGVEYDQPPEPDHGEYLLTWFFDAGPCMSGGAGPTPLTWQEIQSFDNATAFGLTAWEKRILVMLSRSYVSALSRHKDPKSPPPYVSDDDPLGRRRREIEKLRG